MLEPYKTFNIRIVLRDKSIIVTQQWATTIYHAIEKAITKFREVQPDRAKYTISKTLCSH